MNIFVGVLHGRIVTQPLGVNCYEHPAYLRDNDHHVYQKVKIDVFNLTVVVDPNYRFFLAQTVDIEDFREWYDMSGHRQVRRAKFELVGSVKKQ